MHVPAWAGQVLVTALLAALTGVALGGIVMSTPGESSGEEPAPRSLIKTSEPGSWATFAGPAGPVPIIVYVVGGGDSVEMVKSALEGESFIRQISGDPARQSWVITGDGLDLDVLRQVVNSDDAMMNSPQSVLFVDVR
jgi:hypothetical protein